MVMVIKDATNIFTKARLFTDYGMTEGCSSLTFVTLNDPTKQTTDEKLSLLYQQEGVCVEHILTRGPYLMIGYWDQIQKKENFGYEEGWHETGDIGRVDDYGNLWLIGA